MSPEKTAEARKLFPTHFLRKPLKTWRRKFPRNGLLIRASLLTRGGQEPPSPARDGRNERDDVAVRQRFVGVREGFVSSDAYVAPALRKGEMTPGEMSARAPTLRTSGGRCSYRRRPVPASTPLEKRSRLGAKIAAGEFITMVEIVPPKGTDIRKEVEGAKFVKSVGVDAVNIPDSPRASARISNQALSLLMQQAVGIEAILHYTCRDRNVLGIQSDLLGAAATGIHNLICITGDPPKMGNYSDATAVFDVDSIGLVNIVHNLNRGLDLVAIPLEPEPLWIGVGPIPACPILTKRSSASNTRCRPARNMSSPSLYLTYDC